MNIFDTIPGESSNELTMFHIEPGMDVIAGPTYYMATMYKISARDGTLPASGHFANYIVAAVNSFTCINN